MKSPLSALLWLALLGAAVAACRGQTSDEPPIHLNPNMDDQPYFQAQERNLLFEDTRAMRPDIPGTVAVGLLKQDDHLYRATVDGKSADTLPMPLDKRLLRRGQQRYEIYCTPCHDSAGTGEGIIVQRGMLPPPALSEARLRAMPVGEIFSIITNGVRNMPPYAAQIPVEDRWAITAYVRALQIASSATLEQVPEDIRREKGWSQ